MSVAAVPYNISIPYGILDLEGRRIKGLLEKPTYNHYANAGIYLVRRRVLDEIPDGEFFNATDLVEKLIKEGKRSYGIPSTEHGLTLEIHKNIKKPRIW